jgi:uncharacterized glyoxalase superfamily protein PhnB
MFTDPSMHVFTRDINRLVTFYKHFGFRETYRFPKDGVPAHVELTFEKFTIGISSVEAAHDHGLSPNLNGRPIGILLWTDDVDRDYARLTADGAPSLSPPHDFLTNLRSAWVADPDGNPINLAQHRRLE